MGPKAQAKSAQNRLKAENAPLSNKKYPLAPRLDAEIVEGI